MKMTMVCAMQAEDVIYLARGSHEFHSSRVKQLLKPIRRVESLWTSLGGPSGCEGSHGVFPVIRKLVMYPNRQVR